MNTNYFLTKNADWRKQAAMTAVNDLDIEKAFADQASGFVENKLEPLMKAPYHIGFEVVRKNDENTRIIGIFAFKVDDHLLFAPVFFLNGEIKGPLLYRCDTKTFVPATKEWATYLISSLEKEEGHGQPRTRRADSAPLVQMQRLNFRPTSAVKSASVASPINKPSCTCTPVPRPGGNCKVVISVHPDYSSVSTWNNRLPGGESLLKMAAADDGTIRCEFGDEKFMLSAADGRRFTDGAFAKSGASINTPDGVRLQLGEIETQRVKTAFFENIPNNIAEWADDMLVKIAASSKVGVLKELLTEPEVGQHAADAIIKAAADPEFAEALAECYNNPKDLFPSEFTTTKKAATKQADALVIKFEVPTDNRIKKEYFQDGFYILDSRPAETLSMVTEKSPSDITTATGPGVFSLLTNSGKFENDVFVAPYGNPDTTVPTHWIGGANSDNKVIAIKNGRVTLRDGSSLMGVQTHSACDYSGLQERVSKHKTYVLVLKKVAYGMITVHDVKDVDGVQYADVDIDYSPYYGGSVGVQMHVWVHEYAEHKRRWTINPDVAVSNLEHGLIGRDAKFIEVTTQADEKDDRSIDWIFTHGGKLIIPTLEDIGDINNLDDFIYSSWKMPKVEIVKEVIAEKTAGYRFSDGKNFSPVLNRCESLVKLARDMGIHADKAYELMEKVANNGSVKFYLAPMEKVAMRLRVVDRPNFDDEFDSEFGMPMNREKEYKLRIQGEQMFEPPSAIGDMLNPTTVTGLPNETVVTTKTEDLRALADTYKLPHVFEHSVVGTLADTFDAMMLLDKYVSRIEDAVDALYRTLFLLYWRPGDFEKAYGIDDMPNLEAETVSNADGLGAMLLRLLKKTEAYRKGVSARGKGDQGQR